jgi:transcriptional regulator with XRE-family HTH domain
MAKTVGERIRQARQAKQWSGETLAKLAGYSNQSSIGNLENRATGQGGNRIGAIAAALGVSVDWLLNGPDADEVPFIAQPSRALVVESPRASYGTGQGVSSDRPDPWIAEAVRTLASLSEQDRRAAVLCLRAFVHSLGPPGDGQALPVAA